MILELSKCETCTGLQEQQKWVSHFVSSNSNEYICGTMIEQQKLIKATTRSSFAIIRRKNVTFPRPAQVNARATAVSGTNA